METKYYIVARIDGDYAWLKRTDAEEEPLFIARALLPEEIDEGTKLKYEMLQYEIIAKDVKRHERVDGGIHVRRYLDVVTGHRS